MAQQVGETLRQTCQFAYSGFMFRVFSGFVITGPYAGWDLFFLNTASRNIAGIISEKCTQHLFRKPTFKSNYLFFLVKSMAKHYYT